MKFKATRQPRPLTPRKKTASIHGGERLVLRLKKYTHIPRHNSQNSTVSIKNTAGTYTPQTRIPERDLPLLPRRWRRQMSGFSRTPGPSTPQKAKARARPVQRQRSSGSEGVRVRMGSMGGGLCWVLMLCRKKERVDKVGGTKRARLEGMLVGRGSLTYAGLWTTGLTVRIANHQRRTRKSKRGANHQRRTRKPKKG